MLLTLTCMRKRSVYCHVKHLRQQLQSCQVWCDSNNNTTRIDKNNNNNRKNNSCYNIKKDKRKYNSKNNVLDVYSRNNLFLSNELSRDITRKYMSHCSNLWM